MRGFETVEDDEGIYNRVVEAHFGVPPFSSITAVDIEVWLDLHVNGQIQPRRTEKTVSNETTRDRHNELTHILGYSADPQRGYARASPAKAKIDLTERIKPLLRVSCRANSKTPRTPD